MNDYLGHLGKYRLVKLLGHDGFAKVYLGEHTFLIHQGQLSYRLTHYHDAEQQFFQSLSIKEKNVGLDHSCVACNFSGLASHCGIRLPDIGSILYCLP